MSELHTKIGRLLKTERERQNKSLTDLAQELKIAEGHLLAIEAGDIGGVPSELYFKLFARSYADALGVDYAKAMEMIREDLSGGEPGALNGIEDTGRVSSVKPGTPRAENGTRSGRTGLVTVIVVAVGILLAIVWLILSKKDNFVLGSKDADSSGATVTEPVKDSNLVVPSSNREGMRLNLDLVARDRTWAVVIADGDTALQTNLKPWREYYIGAKDSLVVSIGTPLAVELMLNGTSANLTDPEHGTISSVVITPENLARYIQRALEDSLRGSEVVPDSTAVDSSGMPKDTAAKSGAGNSPSKSAGKEADSTERGSTDGR